MIRTRPTLRSTEALLPAGVGVLNHFRLIRAGRLVACAFWLILSASHRHSGSVRSVREQRESLSYGVCSRLPLLLSYLLSAAGVRLPCASSVSSRRCLLAIYPTYLSIFDPGQPYLFDSLLRLLRVFRLLNFQSTSGGRHAASAYVRAVPSFSVFSQLTFARRLSAR